MKTNLKSILLPAILVLCISAAASGQAKFTSVADAKAFITEKAKSVSQPGINYTQAFNFEGKKGMVELTRVTVDDKGKSNTVKMMFYFEHIDVNRVLQIASTKELKLEVNAIAKQKLFNFEKAPGNSAYTDHIDIYFDDSQVSRDVREAILYVIANTAADKLTFGSEAEAYAWLESNVNTNYSADNASYLNTLKVATDQSNKFTVSITKSDAKGGQKKMDYEFYMADFNENSFRINVAGDMLAVNMSTTNNAKVIKYFENGMQKSYINKFDLFLNDPKLAIDVIAAFKYLKTKNAPVVPVKTEEKTGDKKEEEKKTEEKKTDEKKPSKK